MTGILDVLFVLGGLVAGTAIALGCGVGLLVWLAGRRSEPRREAWRPTDEH